MPKEIATSQAPRNDVVLALSKYHSVLAPTTSRLSAGGSTIELQSNKMVRPARVELALAGLKVRCNIQLYYGRINLTLAVPGISQGIIHGQRRFYQLISRVSLVCSHRILSGGCRWSRTITSRGVWVTAR